MTDIYVLYALQDTLLQVFDKSEFCIGEYKEAALCIEPSAGKRSVYFGERGNRYDERTFESPVNAGYYSFSVLTHDERDIEKMCRRFARSIKGITRFMRSFRWRNKIRETQELADLIISLSKSQIDKNSAAASAFYHYNAE